MSDLMYCTEAEVKDILLNLANETDEAPVVFTYGRSAFKNSLKRLVTLVVITKEGNEELVNKIIKYSADNEMVLEFIKSEVNVQNNVATVDYLYVEAIVTPKLI